MDSPIKSTKRSSRGFTLLEIILVIGIFGLLVGVSTSAYSSFKSNENLEIATAGAVEAIRYAQSNSMAGKGDSSWGVKTTSNSITIFKGSTYATRDQSSDQTLDFSGGLIVSGLTEIVFAKITGSTVNTGTLTLANSYGVKNIVINAKGTLTY